MYPKNGRCNQNLRDSNTSSQTAGRVRNIAHDLMTARAATPARSKEHHVAVGLSFWSAFQNGNMEACVTTLHPEVEWHPSPRLDELDVVRGQEDVRNVLQILHDR